MGPFALHPCVSVYFEFSHMCFYVLSVLWRDDRAQCMTYTRKTTLTNNNQLMRILLSISVIVPGLFSILKRYQWMNSQYWILKASVVMSSMSVSFKIYMQLFLFLSRWILRSVRCLNVVDFVFIVPRSLVHPSFAVIVSSSCIVLDVSSIFIRFYYIFYFTLFFCYYIVLLNLDHSQLYTCFYLIRSMCTPFTLSRLSLMSLPLLLFVFLMLTLNDAFFVIFSLLVIIWNDM